MADCRSALMSINIYSELWSYKESPNNILEINMWKTHLWFHLLIEGTDEEHFHPGLLCDSYFNNAVMYLDIVAALVGDVLQGFSYLCC